MSEELVRLAGLSVGYNGKELLSHVNASLHAGELAVLLGSNGRGKSTLLKTLSGSLKPLKGAILLDGKDVGSLSTRDFARLVAVVNTDRVNAALTVREIVGIGRQPHTGFMGRLSDVDHEQIHRSMELTGIASLAERKINSLSDGERQKAMIARALAQQTPVILLDEPTSFLDVASRLETMSLLKSLASAGKGVLFSTHDVAMALKVCSHAWLLPADGGTMVAGTVDDLVKQGLMDTLFTGRAIEFDTSTMDYNLKQIDHAR